MPAVCAAAATTPDRSAARSRSGKQSGEMAPGKQLSGKRPRGADDDASPPAKGKAAADSGDEDEIMDSDPEAPPPKSARSVERTRPGKVTSGACFASSRIVCIGLNIK